MNDRDAPLLPLIKGVEIKPVFVMGQHRSGTTILYKILADTGSFNVTTIYHVLNRDRLLYLHEEGLEERARRQLTERFESLGLKDREFDSIEISDRTPEEYAYALPRQGRKPRLSRENLGDFENFCRKVQYVQSPDRPLLLKNPFDAANFLFMDQAFGSARFIFIHRNPVHVVNSQLKTIRSLLQVRNEYVALVVRRYRRLWEDNRKVALARWFFSERWPFLIRRVAREVRIVNDYFVDHACDLPRDRSLSLTYEGLCREPKATIQKMVNFLDIAPTADLTGSIAPRNARLLPEVKRREQKILQENSHYCRTVGITV